jgi:hypothetical protein
MNALNSSGRGGKGGTLLSPFPQQIAVDNVVKENEAKEQISEEKVA